MCGIAAIVSDVAPLEAGPLVQALSRMAHRGPDGFRVWLSDDKTCAIGHCLLRIIGTAESFQPIEDREAQITLAVNGEFYQYDEQKAALRKEGVEFRTESDSEIAIPLYRKYGPRFVEQLRGEFAFILWDQRQRKLIAARDRFGIKPLYYGWHYDKLYLASEVKGLFGAGFPARWDDEAVYIYQNAHLPSGRTLYDGVRQLLPGHLLIVEQGKAPAVVPYWSWPQASAAWPEVTPQAAALELRQRLVEAVKIRLRADVPVGVYLSGGVDSSAIFGMASQLAARPPTALTLAFGDSHLDESAIAEQTAQRAGGETTVVRATAQLLADSFGDAVYHAEMPAINIHAAGKLILSRAAHKLGLRVVLTGEGSDEMFGGYHHFRDDLQPKAQGESFVPAWLVAAKGNAPFLEKLYRREFSERFRRMKPDELLMESLRRDEPNAPVQGLACSVWMWARTVMPNYLFRLLGDGVEMANSIEGRLPFLDHRVAEYALALSDDLKIRDGREKYILREAMKPFLSEPLFNAKKKPFVGSAVASDLGGPVFQRVEELLLSRAIDDLPFYDPKAIRALVKQVPKLSATSRLTLDPVLTELASMTVLHQRLIRGG